jgi:biotin carboxyl carrier protein
MALVRSELSGSVWKVMVSPGDAVEIGETLLILEAMKMDIPVESPYAGTVLAVHVREGQTIVEDVLLATVEPA